MGKLETNVCYAKYENQSKLWHQGLGHFNYDTLNIMHTKELVYVISKFSKSQKVCEVCQLGKQKMLPFPFKSEWIASEKLQ